MEYLKKGMIRPAQEEEERSRQVSEIIHNIRKSGDEAILNTIRVLTEFPQRISSCTTGN